ncbi:MAG: hypothetical protein M1822_002109 [Bathelium mastoideum]|nr:MAG: hypothetical protein M1822_002109 [Bathelium mastoideum]
MLSGVLIFNQKGENLILRAYRTDCRPRLADVFRIQVISNPQVRSPVLTLGSTTFSHVKHENIYLVAITKSNANAALVLEFLYRLIGLGKSYFGKFDEEAVKNNFVLVYELLDEILDFGYPQNTETETLKMYITTEGVKSERATEDSSKITMQATGALSWRRADIKYRKNEAFVDVIEDVNLLMSAQGTVLRADVNGQIIMRAYLSGTPECKFGLNDRLTLGEDNLTVPSGNRAGTKATKAAAGSVTLEDCQFHQCVKLGKFDTDRTISFIPPDGEFELMRYRATENVNLPFKVHAIVNELGKTKVEYSIAIRANYGNKLFATNVVVRIPTPLNTARITERTSQGKAKYEPEHNNIVWKIPRFTGQSEFVLSAEATLTSMTNQKAWSRPPLSLSFSLLMFTSSGLLVRYLKVFEKSNYSSVKWVRYMTRAGNYEIRPLHRASNPVATGGEAASSQPSGTNLYPSYIYRRLTQMATHEDASFRSPSTNTTSAARTEPPRHSLDFPDGNVLVVLDLHDPFYWLQLHSSILRYNSGALSRLLAELPTLEARPDLGGLYLTETCRVPPGTRAVLTLRDSGQAGEIPSLTTSAPPTTMERASEAIVDTAPPSPTSDLARHSSRTSDTNDSNDDNRGNMHVHAAPNSTDAGEGSSRRRGRGRGRRGTLNSVGPNVRRFRDAFRTLFAAFYGQPLALPSPGNDGVGDGGGDDAQEVVRRGEDLVAVAKVLDAVLSIRGKVYHLFPGL